MRTEKLKNPWLGFALAVLLILLTPNVSRAALISTRGSSSSSNGNIAEYIGEEEFLMESDAGVNATLLATKYINYRPLFQDKQVFPGDKYAIALRKDNRGCQIYNKCRQG